jgi:Tfp pilus assembly protein PilF
MLMIEALFSRIEVAWEEASFCFSEGDLNEARKLLEKVLGMDPEHDQAQQLKAEIEKRFDHAKQLYEEIQNGLDCSWPRTTHPFNEGSSRCLS